MKRRPAVWCVWALLVGLSVVLSACAEDEVADVGIVCGDGEQIEVEEEVLCVFERAVVIETGFMCPPDMPHQHLGGEVVACSANEDLPQERLEEAERTFLERRGQTPEPEPQPEPEPEPECVDEDGDGVCVEEGDCDDGNPQINPELPDLRDGLDNDCDGEVDEDADPNEPVECRSDSDCAEGQICDDGVCAEA